MHLLPCVLGSVRGVPTATDSSTYDVGIAGAGQLARMTCLAAWPLGITVAVLGTPDEPAAPMAAAVVPGSWKSAEDVAALGRVCEVVTLENEFVDADALAAVAAAGTPVRPAADDLATVQDKARQKQRLAAAGLPVLEGVVVRTPAELDAAVERLGLPVMMKARTLGYDGYGNATCTTRDEAVAEFARLDRGDGVLLEPFIEFRRELAVMIARSTTGEVLPYPVVETVQRNHVCHEVIVPAPVSPALADRATQVAIGAAEAAGALGVMGVELFETVDGGIVINELAPRPHNSGHYTIEACETSQFENHLRGILGLPLGPTTLRAPAAAMVNILGSRNDTAAPDRAAAMAVPGAHLHLYDKREVRVRRKMGHVTAIGADHGSVLATARRAVAAVGL